MRHDKRYEKLEALGDWKLEHSSQDIRGMPLVGPEGQRFGVIDDLLVDRDHKRVTAVRLEDGRVTPIEPLVIHDNCVVYGEEASHYADQGAAEGHVVDEEVIPVVEERVAIGKRVSDHGRVINVHTDVVTDTVREDVRLRDEDVSIEKRPVERRVSAADADGMFEGKSVSMTERSEEAVVAKDAVVTDEVVVKKTAADKVEHVEETVRKTDVEVDTDGHTRRRT